ncbi:MAG TPA: tetratricopeptide repeat protein, partial [Candidatus Obscuribacterales bacterium]
MTASPSLAQDATLLQQGLDALQQGHYAEAVSALEQHTRLQPQDLPALQALAEAYLQLKQLDLAEVTLTSAHGLDRNDARTHFLRGRLRFAQQDFARARSEFRTLLYLKAPSGELWYYLAQTYQALGESAQALEALNLGLASEAPGDTQARLLLLQGQLQPELAETALSRAMALKGLSTQLQAELFELHAGLLLRSGRSPELVERQLARLETSLDNLEQAQRLLSQLETWLGQADDPDQARAAYLQQFEALYDRHPGQPLLRQQLIRLFERQGYYEKLQALYQFELIQNAGRMTDQERAVAFHRLADVYLKQGYLDLAFKNYENASKLNPHDTDALKRMGVIYFVAQKPGEAVKLFQRVLQDQPLDRENLLFLSLGLALTRQDNQARQLLAEVPADVRPEV